MHVHIPFSTRRKDIHDKMTMEQGLILSVEESQFHKAFLKPDPESQLSQNNSPLE